YDCGEDTTAVPHAFNATHHNVIEHNVFAEASAYYSTSGGNGLQYAGQDGIIRYNVFYRTNVGLGMQVYSDEALYNHRNRVYHNVFYDNDCAGIAVRGDALNNVYKNNVLFKNKGISGDCFGVGQAQVVYRAPLAEFFFERNDILNNGPGEAVIHEEFGDGDTLAHFEAQYPALFADNLQVLPVFRDEAADDFRLRGTSPLINAGAFLARTASSGSGTLLPIDDARYFRDDFSITGATGDHLQLAGQFETAVIVGIDYAANTLTLDRALTWSANQGVSLAYAGSAPDVGAYEFTPELMLYGSPADRAIHLTWTIDSALPPTSTWRIAYYSQTVPITITNILSPTRAYELNGLTNYAWYTVTLNALLDATPLYTDTLKLMPTDRLLYLPIVWR
ncbi:MAG: right-handed parallel beta-helix repeat-containing protein, partial [Chloroflexi bacterium]|nr:right-handed parallel beta-helix repeat-containing protein [Chloroflexota bacterium]